MKIQVFECSTIFCVGICGTVKSKLVLDPGEFRTQNHTSRNSLLNKYRTCYSYNAFKPRIFMFAEQGEPSQKISRMGSCFFINYYINFSCNKLRPLLELKKLSIIFFKFLFLGIMLNSQTFIIYSVIQIQPWNIEGPKSTHTLFHAFFLYLYLSTFYWNFIFLH